MSRTIGTNVSDTCSETHLTINANRHLAVRIPLRLEWGFPLADFWLNRCRELGMFCLPILQWNKPRPQTDAEWGAWHYFLETALKRYPWKIWWQPWNEPNNLRVPEWVFPDPSSYRKFMDDTARYMRRINPNVKVVAGGIACGGFGGKAPSSSFNWDWFRQPASVDRVAVHTYSSTSDGAAYAIHQARRYSEQPVWCTELGRKMNMPYGWDEAKQALWFEHVDAKTPTVPKWWFRFRDGEGYSGFEGYGAVRSNYSARPVWYSLARAVNAQQNQGRKQ